MQSLPTLPNVTKLSSWCTRILGGNPGKYTLQGTNTYLLASTTSSAAILLDTAQGFDSYITHLRPLLSSSTRLTIILSHWHEDHVGGLPSTLRLLQELGAPKPRVFKFSSDAAKDEEFEQSLRDQNLEACIELPSKGESILDSGLLSALRHGQTFGGSDGLPELEVLHTPGHTSDSISLLCRPTGTGTSTSEPPVLFTFDTVLGHGTAIFDDLSAYMKSLSTCIDALESASPAGDVRLLPGHGEIIEDGVAKLKEYRQHRQDREDQVVAALREADGARRTAGDLCRTVYNDSIPESLIPAATRGLILHLEKLEKDKQVSRTPVSDAEEPPPLPGWFDEWLLAPESDDRAKF